MGGLRTTNTFHSISKTNKQTFVKHRVIQTTDLVEATGTDLIELTLEMHFHGPYTLAPSAGITTLESVMAMRIPLPLIVGRVPLGRGALTLFVIEAIDSKMSTFVGSGLAVADVSVKLLEYPNPLGSLGPLSALGGALPGLSGIVATLNNVANLGSGALSVTPRIPRLSGVTASASNIFSSITGGTTGLSRISSNVQAAAAALQPGGISGVKAPSATMLQGALASLAAAGKASAETVPK
jgi:hypothetical protein